METSYQEQIMDKYCKLGDAMLTTKFAEAMKDCFAITRLQTKIISLVRVHNLTEYEQQYFKDELKIYNGAKTELNAILEKYNIKPI